MYLSHFIAKQDTIFKDICFKQGNQFCSACSSIGLIYYGPENMSFRSLIPCTNYVIIVIIKFFLFFFPNQFFQKNYIFLLLIWSLEK